jgi:hypothetical protein
LLAIGCCPSPLAKTGSVLISGEPKKANQNGGECYLQATEWQRVRN